MLTTPAQRKRVSSSRALILTLLALTACSLACASVLPGYAGVCEVTSEEDGFYACYDGVDGSQCRSIGRGQGNAPAGSSDKWYTDEDCHELGYKKMCEGEVVINPRRSFGQPYEVGDWMDTTACDYSTPPEHLAGGSSGGDGVRFTCSQGSICVEYTIKDASRAQQLRAQCASSSDGHTCGRSNAKTCRHQNASNGDVSCTVTTSPPSDHDDLCRADPSARPGGC